MHNSGMNLSPNRSEPENHLSIEEARRDYWLALTPFVRGQGTEPLNDYELSLLATLVFRTGKNSAPGVEALKSMRKVCEAIGSHRSQGSCPAKRPLITKAANNLSARQLLSRRVDGKKCLWTLCPQQVTIEPQWGGAYDYCARLWRRQSFGAGAQVRAAATRLAFIVDDNGKWQGSLEHLAAHLQVKSVLTAERRVTELQAADKAITAQLQWTSQRQATIELSAPEPLLSADEYRQLAKQLLSELWYPELVNEAIKRAGKQLKTGRVTPARGVNGFYRPVLALQEQYNNPALVKYALEETIRAGILDKPNTLTWHRYALAICKNNRRRFPLARQLPTNTDLEAKLRADELAMRERLHEAARANGSGDSERARELLSEALAAADSLAELFDGDTERARQAIQLAFKQGQTDALSVKPDEYALDFLPEWQPGQAIRKEYVAQVLP